jgi:hypothetical protein
VRRIALVTAATLAILAVGSFVPNRAKAMTVTTPAGLAAALDDTGLAQDVAYVCRRLWICGPYGGYCGWRRSCWWTGNGPYYYGYGGPYSYYGRPYRYRYGW